MPLFVGIVCVCGGMIVGSAVAVGYMTHRALSVPQLTRHRAEYGEITEDPNEVVVGPPTMRDGTGMRDWINYHTRGQYTWKDVVTRFYSRAAADPQIASYFATADMATLQAHFAKTMIWVTDKGLPREAIAKLGRDHQDVRDRQGRPITGEVFDKTINTLVAVLHEFRIPGEAIGELAKIVPPLRAALVR